MFKYESAMDALWVAGCAWFVVGEWMHRPVKEACPVRKQPPKPYAGSERAVVSNALFLFTLALDLGHVLAKASIAGRRPG